jgi:hypothetical protein
MDYAIAFFLPCLVPIEQIDSSLGIAFHSFTADYCKK